MACVMCMGKALMENYGNLAVDEKISELKFKQLYVRNPSCPTNTSEMHGLMMWESTNDRYWMGKCIHWF